MKKRNAIILFLTVFISGMVMFSTVSSAYLDPSAVTFIWQALAGIVVVCAGSISFNYKKIVRKLKGGSNYKPKDIEAIDSLTDGFDDSEFDLCEEVSQKLREKGIQAYASGKKHSIDDAFDESFYAAEVVINDNGNQGAAA